MRSSSDFVPLDRTFHVLSTEVERDEYDVDNLPFVGEQLAWRELLERPRVVILAEAGAGKTREIRETTIRLRAEGKPAFFIQLDAVADGFETAFELGSFPEFEAWARGSDNAYFFLDSVDEARLRSPADFERAIRRIGDQLRRADLTRARVVITGRPHAWRANTDLALCRQHLISESPRNTAERGLSDGPDAPMMVQESRNEPQEISVVALNDLSRAQVGAFARARGVSDVNTFIQSVDRADAWAFTTRPKDLEDLLEFWTKNNLIESHLALMQANVRRRLQETDPNRAESQPLPFNDAEIGVRLAAAACTLARIPTIKVPGGDGPAAKGIALRELLYDWDQRDHANLLSLPVFDEAVYGTVRFHHRSVRDYLCAEWFAELLKQRTSRRKIEGVLFCRQYEMEVVVPETRPILPWLCIFDQGIRARVARLAPEVFFEGGDPSALPADLRGSILQGVAREISRGTMPWTYFDNAAVARFATPELTDVVRDLIRTHANESDVLPLLLRMIRSGSLTGALPETKAIARDASAEHYVRIAAFHALQAVGTPADMNEIRQLFACEANELDRDWIAELLPSLEPTDANLVWLSDVLVKSEPTNPYGIDDLSYALDEFVDRIPQHLVATFVEHAARLLDQPPVVEVGRCQMSQRHSWMLRAAGAAVHKLVRKRRPEALGKAALGILQKIPMAHTFARDEIANLHDTVSELEVSVAAWPELKWTIFWRLVESERFRLSSTRGDRLDQFHLVPAWHSFVRFDANDLESALENAKSRTLRDDRLIALDVALIAYASAGRPRAARQRLKLIVSGTHELEERLAAFLQSRRRSHQTSNIRRTTAALERQVHARKEKERSELIAAIRIWEQDLDGHLRSPQLPSTDGITRAQAILLEQARQCHKSPSQFARNIWQALIPEFGERVATAFRDGALGYWRKRRPTLASEGAPLNTIDTRDILGLVGLSIEASEDPEWLSSLSDEEAEIAFRLAMHELNGFPSWFQRLYERFSHTLSALAVGEIRFELSAPAAATSNYLLADVSWSGQWMWKDLGGPILEILDEYEPADLEKLRQALIIVQGSSVSNDAMARLAAGKASAIENPDHAATWFAVWVGVDPASALPALRSRLARIAVRAQAVSFAMVFITQLVSTHRSRAAARSAYRTPDHLKTLYLLVGSYVSEQDDIRRAGTGVYSPGLRDAAQDARNMLFSMLRELRGKDAFVAMMEIARRHPDPALRASADRYARDKAEKDSSRDWTVQQVRKFHDDLERVPRNHRDLFDLVVMRIEDLKDSLEEGDVSEAAILMRVKNETELRNSFANRLQSAEGRYSIGQENELADGKRSDLRFDAPSVNGPVPLELKLSHHWGAAELFERLENQLCRDYLRDVRSAFGLFVVVHQGKGNRKQWTLPNGAGRVDFAGLIDALKKHWTGISHRIPWVDDVHIVGIDLTKRSSPRSPTRRSSASASRSDRRSGRRRVPSTE